MRSIIFSILLLFPTLCFSKPLTLNEIGESVCRVGAGSAYGSGTAIHDDGSKIYVLTNAHVVGSSRSVNLEFFRYGRKTPKLPASVIWKAGPNNQVDFALCTVDKSEFGNLPPRIMPIVQQGHKVAANDYLVSGGHPQARWLQLWEGFSKGTDSDGHVIFSPSPLGGQSGSGLHTVVNGETRLAAVITWRYGGTGLRLDGRGYDTAYGKAISMDTLRAALAGKANTKADPLWRQTIDKLDGWSYVSYEKLYALGSDNNFYEQTPGRMQVVVPPGQGITILRWNIPAAEVQNWDPRWPDRNFPPIIPNRPSPDGGRPSPDNGGGNGNPFGLPPNLLDDPSANPDKAKELQDKLDALQSEYDKLSGEFDAKVAVIDDLQSQIDGLKAKGVTSNNYIDDLEQRLKDKTDDANNALNNLLSAEADLNTIREQLRLKKEELGNAHSKHQELIDDNDDLAEENKQAEVALGNEKKAHGNNKVLRNLFGGGALGLGGLALRLWWKRRGRDRLDDFTDGLKDKAKDKVEDRVEGIVGRMHDRINDLEERLTGQRDNEFIEEGQDRIDDILEDRLNDLFGEKFDGLFDRLNDVLDRTVSSKLGADDDVKKNEITNVVVNHGFADNLRHHKPSQRMVDFCDLARRDGENVEELACYAGIYEEAMKQLRAGRLTCGNAVRGTQPVQGQQIIADKIDEWVKSTFVSSLKKSDLDRHTIIHNVTLTYLYRQAVQKLRRGEFNVLGHKEAADAIERWVNNEFLQRLGVSI